MLVNWGVFENYDELTRQLTSYFLSPAVQEVENDQWQSTDVSNRPEMVTYELPPTSFVFRWWLKDDDVEGMQKLIPANHEWAETHFQERVSGIPHNPPPSHEIWPYAQASNEEWKQGGQFSHTYPERIWPKDAGYFTDDTGCGVQAFGIRYAYGDLVDVLSLLVDHPLTRQAYLPIWFPEDTGVVHGERVPCTLGYHFMIRNGYLTVTYYMRSCDFRRHFADDLYMAARLAQWAAHSISEKLQDRHGMTVRANAVIMHIASLHVFKGDLEIMRKNRHKEMNFTSQYGSGGQLRNRGASARAGAILHQSIMDGLG